MLDERKEEAFCTILREELQLATGCTELIAVAYCAARLRQVLGQRPCRILAEVSGNILKNVKSVVVPNTGGRRVQKYGGFALETQHYPCSPSHPEFPTTVLRAGKVFRATTTLRFFTGKQCGKL